MKMRCVLIGILPLVLLFSGCGPRLDPGLPGFSEDMSDEEKIARVLADVHEGLEKRKIYRVLAHVSRDYRDKDGRDYEAIVAYLQQIIGGYVDVSINRARPLILVHGDRARVLESFGTYARPLDLRRHSSPINLTGQVSVYLERVDSAWKIVEWGPIR